MTGALEVCVCGHSEEKLQTPNPKLQRNFKHQIPLLMFPVPVKRGRLPFRDWGDLSETELLEGLYALVARTT